MTARTQSFGVRTDAEGILSRISPSAGKVVGVHERSATAMLAGVPVNVQTVEDALHPLGILVPRGVLEHVRPDMLVRLTWPQIVLGSVEATLEPSIPASPSPGPLQAELLGANLVRLDRALALGRRPSAVNEAVFGARTEFSDPLERLGEALEKGGQVDLFDWLTQCGAGEGATPAWDDLVTGILLADRLWPRAIVSASTAFLAAARERTTPVAWWQLQFAAMGLSSLRVERLMAALGTRPVAMAELMRVIECGHSSGSDILSGAWFCLTRRAVSATGSGVGVAAGLRRREAVA